MRRARASGESVLISALSMVGEGVAGGSSNPASSFKSVDLPAPLGPTIASTRLGTIVHVTERRTGFVGSSLPGG